MSQCLFCHKRREVIFGETAEIVMWNMARAAAGVFAGAFYFLTLQYLPIGDATALISLSTLVALILGCVWKERVTAVRVCAMCMLVFGGVLITHPTLVFGGGDGLSRQDMIGYVTGLLGAFFVGMDFLTMRFGLLKGGTNNQCVLHGHWPFMIVAPAFSFLFPGERFNFNIDESTWWEVRSGCRFSCIISLNCKLSI